MRQRFKPGRRRCINDRRVATGLKRTHIPAEFFSETVVEAPHYLINYQKLNQLLIKFHFKENALERSVNWFDLYGKIIILLGRLIPIIRSIISIPAGITKMNFFNFSVYTIIGSLIWNAILVYLGVILGNNWQMISFYLNRYSIVVAIVLIIIVIIKRKFLKSKK